MTETPENPETPKEEDLNSLIGGFDFTPDWAKEEPGVKKTSVSAKGRDGGRRGGPRPPGKSSRGHLKGVRVKPRRDAGSGPREGGNRNRDNRATGSRPPRPPRPPRVPVHVDFIPEKKRLSKVVNVIRQTRRVFPLRVVAEKFMENPAFLSVKYTVKKNTEEEDTDFALYVCKANGMVFSDRAACEAYILDHGIEAYYESQVKEVEPPKGSFPGIGRHTKSQRLIGPPNWHGYQARLEEIRQEVDPTCPPDIFSRQVDMIKDDEVIEEWKHEVSRQVFYRSKAEDPKPADPAETSADSSAPEAQTAEPDAPSEPEAAPDSAESPEPETDSGQESTEASTPSPEEPPTSEEGGDAASAEAESPEEAAAPASAEAPPEEEAAEPASEEAPKEDDRPFDLSREEVEAEFREKVLPRLIKKTQRAIMPGVLLEKMTDPALVSSTQYHFKRESERPNSIIFALRPAFKHMRLRVYRHEGQLMVSSVEPHPLPDDLKVTPEIRQILDYVSNHPLCQAKEALEGVAKESQAVTPDLVSHFRWLIEKGHLIEFHDETLLVPAPTPKKS